MEKRPIATPSLYNLTVSLLLLDLLPSYISFLPSLGCKPHESRDLVCLVRSLILNAHEAPNKYFLNERSI